MISSINIMITGAKLTGDIQDLDIDNKNKYQDLIAIITLLSFISFKFTKYLKNMKDCVFC